MTYTHAHAHTLTHNSHIHPPTHDHIHMYVTHQTEIEGYNLHVTMLASFMTSWHRNRKVSNFPTAECAEILRKSILIEDDLRLAGKTCLCLEWLQPLWNEKWEEIWFLLICSLQIPFTVENITRWCMCGYAEWMGYIILDNVLITWARTYSWFHKNFTEVLHMENREWQWSSNILNQDTIKISYHT